jgi:hypothetical protein
VGPICIVLLVLDSEIKLTGGAPLLTLLRSGLRTFRSSALPSHADPLRWWGGAFHREAGDLPVLKYSYDF